MSGEIEVDEQGNFSFSWATESHIRDALAEVARLSGWFVRTEHVVDGWGRPDLYLTSGFSRIAVEVKTDLLTRSACRKAVQQAAGYRRAMPELEHAVLVAASIDDAAMSEYRISYPEVWVTTAGDFLGFLRFDEETLHPRRNRAALLTRAAQSRAEMQARALKGLPVPAGDAAGEQTERINADV